MNTTEPENEPQEIRLTAAQQTRLQNKAILNIVAKIKAGGVPTKRETELLEKAEAEAAIKIDGKPDETAQPATETEPETIETGIPLRNARYERFAQYVAQGRNLTDAYARVFTETSRDSARKNAARLKARDGIAARVRELQQAHATAAVMSLFEKRKYLASVVRTPLDDIDGKSPLCAAHTVTFTKAGRTHEFRKESALKAIELDAKLAGEFTDKVEHMNPDGSPLAAYQPTVRVILAGPDSEAVSIDTTPIDQ